MGKAGYILYLDSGKAFDTVSYDVLISKLGKYSLNEITVRCIYNWLKDLTQNIVINDLQSKWEGITAPVTKNPCTPMAQSDETQSSKVS